MFTFTGLQADVFDFNINTDQLTTMKQAHYVPALKYSWLTRFYDPVVALTTREKKFRVRLIEQAGIRPGERILDLGCGTGTFLVMLKSRYPAVELTGLDGDPTILSQAGKKISAAGMNIRLDESMSYSTPYPDGEFDTVFSSLFFHHLNSVEKIRTIREAYRVLKPGGAFHVCDWGRPSNPLSRMMFLGVRFLDGFEVTRDNVKGWLPSFIKGVGFEQHGESNHIETMLGTLDIISVKKPVNCNEEESL